MPWAQMPRTKLSKIDIAKMLIEKAAEAEAAKAILFRETTLIIGALIVILVLMVWIYFGGNLAGSFILAAFFSIFPLLAIFKRKIHGK